jgi:hypothetical protein
MTILALGSFLLGAVFGGFSRFGYFSRPRRYYSRSLAPTSLFSSSPFLQPVCRQAMRQACFHASSQRYGDVTKIQANYRVRPRQVAAQHPHLFSKSGTIDWFCQRAAESRTFLSSRPPNLMA